MKRSGCESSAATPAAKRDAAPCVVGSLPGVTVKTVSTAFVDCEYVPDLEGSVLERNDGDGWEEWYTCADFTRISRHLCWLPLSSLAYHYGGRRHFEWRVLVPGLTVGSPVAELCPDTFRAICGCTGSLYGLTYFVLITYYT